MTNRQSSPLPQHASPSVPGLTIVGRLQSFALYAENAIGEARLPLVRIHELSLRTVVTQAVPDLREGAIVRLLIPAVGWRHLEVQWARRGMACYRLLLPLLPFELHAALETAAIDRTDPPRHRRWTARPLASGCRGPLRRSRRRPIAVPSRPDIRALGQGLIATLAQCAAAMFAMPLRTA